jgi:hypothetical protein
MIGIYMLMFALGVTTVLSIIGLIAVRDWYKKAHPSETKTETKTETETETETA